MKICSNIFLVLYVIENYRIIFLQTCHLQCGSLCLFFLWVTIFWHIL